MNNKTSNSQQKRKLSQKIVILAAKVRMSASIPGLIVRFNPSPVALQRLEAGPISPHIRSFADLIAKQNYSCGTGWLKLRLAARFSRWLKRRRITLKQLDDEAQIEKFLNERWKRLARHSGDQVTMDLLLQHLREVHAAAPRPATDGSEMDLLRLDYQTFLLEECSLFHSTCAVYLNVVRRFLTHCFRSNSHFAERGCVQSTSRSAWIGRSAWCCADVLRLVGTTQPRSGS